MSSKCGAVLDMIVSFHSGEWQITWALPRSGLPMGWQSISSASTTSCHFKINSCQLSFVSAETYWVYWPCQPREIAFALQYRRFFYCSQFFKRLCMLSAHQLNCTWWPCRGAYGHIQKVYSSLTSWFSRKTSRFMATCYSNIGETFALHSSTGE